ncbi:PilZ domain-containing protein [Parasphingorhabdus sp.]|uniref:PilZ domain-containing protein n=1 Tax=Parasphingorhabdus sp. TaxID=2709688 RepID=UPI0030015BF7
MTPPAYPQSELPSDLAVEDLRASTREIVSAELFVRQSNTQLFRTTLYDLSVTGFRMESCTNLDTDKLVFVSLPGLQTLAARIVWENYNDYGCQFTAPLHPAVLDHVVSALRTF